MTAFIKRVPASAVPEDDRVPDDDHIIQVHSIRSRIMKMHHELYLELMHRTGPLSKFQRELIAVTVSACNGCHY